MKKSLSAFLLLIMIFAVCLAITACDIGTGNIGGTQSGDESMHVCTPGEFKTVSEPTCTTEGKREKTCTECGKVVKSETIPASHTASEKWEIETEATCNDPGCRVLYCAECGALMKKEEIPPTESHEFGEKELIISTKPSCTQEGILGFNVRCKICGTTEYFEDTEPALEHTEGDWYVEYDPTCGEEGLRCADCTVCGQTVFSEPIPKLTSHTPGDWDIILEATCKTEGLKKRYCKECGEQTDSEKIPLSKEHTPVTDKGYAATETKDGLSDGSHCSVCDTVLVTQQIIPAEVTGLQIKSKQMSWNGEFFYTVVPYGTHTFSFKDDITVNENAKYELFYDEELTWSATGAYTAIHDSGDNDFYIRVQNAAETKVYKAIIRMRPMYTVSFNTGCKTKVDSINIEEDGYVPMPNAALSLAGYDFDGWSFDFSKPLKGNVEINAIWKPKDDTPYKVEYYYAGIYGGSYLDHTENLEGTTGSTVTLVPDRIEHFTFVPENSVISGEITGDGKLTLKLYYARNTYTVYLDSEHGKFGKLYNEGYHTYGESAGASPYVGCVAVWYDKGGNEVHRGNSYEVVDRDLTVKFEIMPEMENFIFTPCSPSSSCEITGIKDTSVTHIVIPSGMRLSLASNLFEKCKNLMSITVGDGVDYISVNWENTHITEIILSSENTGCYVHQESDCEIHYGESKLKEQDGFYYYPKSDGTVKLITYIGDKSELIFPKKLDGKDYYISRYAFSERSDIKSVKISSAVTEIKQRAFYCCTEIAALTFENGVEFIGDEAFYYCTDIEELIIPDSVTEMGYAAFGNCLSLETVKISNGITMLLSGEFSFCESLKEIEFPSDLERIGRTCFRGCEALMELVIPESVKQIDDYAFESCSNLKKITVLATDINLDKNAFYDCDSITTVICPASALPAFNSPALLTVEVTSGTEIPNNALHYCNTLLSVSLPETVTTIGQYAFAGCEKLEELKLPDSVSYIGYCAFASCSSLSFDSIPKNLTYIGKEAFYNTNLEGTLVISNKITYIGQLAFGYCGNIDKLVIKAGSYEYFHADVFSGTYPKYLVVEDGAEGFSGNLGLRGVTYVSIPLSKLGDFMDCANKPIEYEFYGSGILPREWARGSSSIEKITFHGENIEIGENCLKDATALATVNFEHPDGIVIGNNAFYGCTALNEIFLGENVKIGEGAFDECTAVERLTIGTGAVIDQYSFKNCVPKSYACLAADCIEHFDLLEVEELIVTGTGTLNEILVSTDSLRRLEIREGITALYGASFKYAENLETIVIAGSLIDVYESSLSACTRIKYATASTGVLWAFDRRSIVTLNVNGGTELAKTLINSLENVETIHIGKSITHIEGSFETNTKLQSITVDPENTHFEVKDGALYHKLSGELIWSFDK